MNINSILSEKLGASPSNVPNYSSNVIGGQRDTAFSDMMNKLTKEDEDQAQLEKLKETDYEAYLAKMLERDLASCRSIGALTRVAEEYNLSTVNFRGTTIAINHKDKKMSIGSMEPPEDVIHVGTLSSGFDLSFNCNNTEDIGKIIDLFTPEDINKILTAITNFNMKNNTHFQIETIKDTAFL